MPSLGLREGEIGKDACLTYLTQVSGSNSEIQFIPRKRRLSLQKQRALTISFPVLMLRWLGDLTNSNNNGVNVIGEKCPDGKLHFSLDSTSGAI